MTKLRVFFATILFANGGKHAVFNQCNMQLHSAKYCPPMEKSVLS